MNAHTIYADFNNADREGRLRLNGAETLRDLARLGTPLAEGLPLIVHDEELAADGVASYSAVERVWTARIDWSLLRNWMPHPAAVGTNG